MNPAPPVIITRVVDFKDFCHVRATLSDPASRGIMSLSLNAGGGDVLPDLSEGNFPTGQEQALIGAHLLVQQIHAASGRGGRGEARKRRPWLPHHAVRFREAGVSAERSTNY